MERMSTLIPPHKSGEIKSPSLSPAAAHPCSMLPYLPYLPAPRPQIEPIRGPR